MSYTLLIETIDGITFSTTPETSEAVAASFPLSFVVARVTVFLVSASLAVAVDSKALFATACFAESILPR